MENRERIRKYWEGRAKEQSNSTAATTNDIFLRDLEIKTIINMLKSLEITSSGTVLDIGCGDGYSTIGVAREMPGCSFLGMDYSENMISIARQRLHNEPLLEKNINFEVGDVTDLENCCGNLTFDVVISDRCLINLESLALQKQAIGQIAGRIKPGGYYIAIENFIEGQNNLNEARHKMGLPEIAVRWHNLYFKEDEFIEAVQPYFNEVVIKDFSSAYYFASRIIYSKMCKMRGEEPDYHHEIHQLAVELPWFGQFSPVRMAVMKRK